MLSKITWPSNVEMKRIQTATVRAEPSRKLYACTVLVDVVRMRRQGVKLPREEVRTALPVRGELQISACRPGYFAGQANPPLLAGLVEPGTCSWALPPLDGAQVTRIYGPHLIIVGIEERVVTAKRVEKYRQAWWCRIVPRASEAPATNGGGLRTQEGRAVDEELRMPSATA